VTTAIAPAAVPARSNALWNMTVAEVRMLARERLRLVFGVGFPVMLLIIFGSIPSFTKPSDTFGGHSLLEAYVPILIGFSLALLALTSLPSALADYRDKGILRRLRTTPAGPGRVLAAQLITNLGMAVVASILVLAIARLGYHVPLPRQLGGFVLSAVLTAAALLGLGLLIAALAPNGKAAQTSGALLFYPMMFFAGLWLPLDAMPKVLRHISHGTPLGAAVQALQDSAQGHWPHPLQLVTLLIWAVAACAAAAKLFRWE